MKTETELLKEANDMMRSFLSVVDRKGKATNWEPLRNKLIKMLREQHDHLNPHETYHVPAPRRPDQLKSSKKEESSEKPTVGVTSLEEPQNSGLTTDRNDPDLGRGVDVEKTGQHKKYLVLSDEERAKGFVRPVRNKYVHVGRKVVGVLKPLTDEQRERYAGEDYVMYEDYEGKQGAALGRYLTRREYEHMTTENGVTYVGGCGALTVMNQVISETYARDPKFYGATFCMGCSMHLPVGEDGEFIWDDGSNERVGT